MYNAKEEDAFHDVESLASLVKRLGNPESTTMLHSECSIFQIPQVDGVIAYQSIGSCALAVGDPICLPEDTAKLTNAFHQYCKEHKLKTVYLLVYQDFGYFALNNGCKILIQVGNELSINPIKFRKRRKLRWKINHAQQQGVVVKEYKNFDASLEDKMKQAIDSWSKERKGPQIHLGNINFHSNAHKRIFYAEQNNKIIGLLMLTPVDRYQGWVMSFYFAQIDAPQGTTEHMICSMIDQLAKENSSFLCLGAVSGSKLGKTIGLSPLTKFFADLIFKMAKAFFKLDSKAQYFNKYDPNLRPTFLLCREKLALSELLAIKKILNVGL